MLTIASLAPVACGGGEETVTASTIDEQTKGLIPGTLGQDILEFEPDPDGDLAFTFDQAVTRLGVTTFRLNNPNPVGHDLAVETRGGRQLGKTEVVAEDTDYIRLAISEDEYVYYCSVPGHRKAGMEGTVTVE